MFKSLFPGFVNIECVTGVALSIERTYESYMMRHAVHKVTSIRVPRHLILLITIGLSLAQWLSIVVRYTVFVA